MKHLPLLALPLLLAGCNLSPTQIDAGLKVAVAQDPQLVADHAALVCANQAAINLFSPATLSVAEKIKSPTLRTVAKFWPQWDLDTLAACPEVASVDAR